jgi:hypothetical protein
MVMHAGVAPAFLTAKAAGRFAGHQHLADHLLVRTCPAGSHSASRSANIGAIEVEPDAPGKILEHPLPEAGVRAGGAGLGTVVAFFNAPNQRVVCVAPDVRMGADHLHGVHGAQHSFYEMLTGPDARQSQIMAGRSGLLTP